MMETVLGAGAAGLCPAAKLSDVCEVHADSQKESADTISAKGFKMTGILGEVS